ncbi:MAG: peptidoglycan DD-metalloendopeptidase family protein [Lachnospiraceae bacterium]|nr:peptidoglycan DD-metalloendopeptidase family protein [Lachnospiraceae bacterium]
MENNKIDPDNRNVFIKMLCIFVCTALVFVLPQERVYADELREQIKQEEQAVKNASAEKDRVNQSIALAKALVGSLKSGKADVESYIEELDLAIGEIRDNIDEIDSMISANEIEEKKAEEELVAAEKKCEAQYADMKKQLRFIYRNRAGGLADILFLAKDIGDLLNKSTYIEALSEYDKKKLDEYISSVNEVKAKREKLEGIRESLEEARQEKLKESEDMEGLIEDKQKELSSYDAQIGSKEQQIAEYERMAAEQDAQIKALESALAASRKALEEAERPKYDGGMFTMPCPGYTRISDEFGMRMHPTLGVNKMHNGVDFAAPSGTSILAAYDGVVAAAGYSPSMGNYVMIDHGDDLLTVYMHASSLAVGTGQQVSAGQKIASVGSTGRSTGPHLHFGVRKNGAYINPWNYLK